jgi:predicted TIM-barrel fold metal-dependent hydrolase
MLWRCIEFAKNRASRPGLAVCRCGSQRSLVSRRYHKFTDSSGQWDDRAARCAWPPIFARPRQDAPLSGRRNEFFRTVLGEELKLALNTAKQRNVPLLPDDAAGIPPIQVIYYRWDNRYLADILKKYPYKFCGVARVNPEDPAAPDHLSHLTEEQGFQGVRISPAADSAGDWIDGALMPPLWKRCQDLRVPMTVLAPVTWMPAVARLAERFPDLTIVIDHVADTPLHQPAELEKLRALRRFPEVYVKISHSWSLSAQSYPYLDSQEQIKTLYDTLGPKRLLAGTDWHLVEKVLHLRASH